ncbi:MAG TPA: tetratricopeptide repeat protein [Rhodocyclaceae bacterium]|nr:tetratricopeptide repeat protein [Rhodocyclaceae bacterium]
MSLLMDALKKAEAAKRQAAPSADDHAAADDAGTAVEPGKPLPELPRELSLLDDQFPSAQTDAAGAGPRPQGSVSAVSENQREREAAHNLFAAKRTASRAPFWIGLSLTTLVAVGAIGTWFWWQLQPRPGGLQPGPALGRGAPPPQAAASVPVAPTASPAASPTLAAAPPPTEAGSPARDTKPPDSALPAAAAIERPTSAGIARATRTPSATPAASASDPTRAGRLGAEAPVEQAPEPLPGVRAHRGTTARDTVHPLVAKGYAAFNAGDLDSAKRHYDEALRMEPRSLDALNGMAAVALRAGRRDVAESYLARVLEIDPKDGFALAASTSLRSRVDAQSAESRFKALIAAAPESPAAHFGLGNLYAREGRWSEAQQAYFRAYTAEPDNPDFLFNLAVSLDHLKQTKLARQYYQSALATARQGAFDREQAGARIRELDQTGR